MSPRTATSAARTAVAPQPTLVTLAVPLATSMPLSGYRGLKVWQRAMDLVAAVYVLSKAMPAAEDELRTELRRTALVVPAQIAAGNALYQRAEYLQHISAAHGAVARLECLLQAADRLGAAAAADVAPLVLAAVEVGRMLRALARSVQSKAEREAEEAVNWRPGREPDNTLSDIDLALSEPVKYARLLHIQPEPP